MQQRSQQPPSSNTGDTPSKRSHGKGRNWSDLIEEQLEEARARGDFDNLEGKGQPLQLDDNPHAGDKALAYSLLKNNNLAPPEIERGKEIDAELRRAEELLAVLRRRRDALTPQRGTASASDRHAYNLVRDTTESRYEEALRGINSKILSLNIVAPAALHRRRVDLDAKMQAFEDEFPHIEE
jgi:DnaJ homolog subfamily C member 28